MHRDAAERDLRDRPEERRRARRDAPSAAARRPGATRATCTSASDDPDERDHPVPELDEARGSPAVGNGVVAAARPVLAAEARAGQPHERARGDDELERRRTRPARGGGSRAARRVRPLRCHVPEQPCRVRRPSSGRRGAVATGARRRRPRRPGRPAGARAPAAANVGLGDHGRSLGGKRDEQPARGLRVVRERLGDGGRRRSRRAGPRTRGCAGRRRCGRRPRPSSSAPGQGGQRGGLELDARTPLRVAISYAWPSRPKPVTSVTACGRERPQRVRRGAVERRHRRDRRVERARRVAIPSRRACSTSPVPSGFVRNTASPGRASLFARSRRDARCRRRRGRTSARRRGSCARPRGSRPPPRAASAAPARISPSISVGELLGEGRHREREQRRAAHREHVVERVRRRDPPEGARVVDDGREEVDGEDERALVVEAVDRRVVGRVEADEQVAGLGRHDPREERLEPRGRSTSRRSHRPSRAR